MGEHKIKPLRDQADRNRFCRAVLSDISALEQMLLERRFESGVQRIGAEQELCLIGPDFSPASIGPEILKKLKADAYTSELARYNLEINLSPKVLRGGCFQETHRELNALLELGEEQAEPLNGRLVLAGILPTIERWHLRAENMTPAQRYRILSDRLLAIRGEEFKIHLEGVDELIASLDSVLFEACNTSFQLHLQVDPEDFVTQYNWSQLISGPVLAIAANSPLLLGRELWMETRIALFKQSLDTRNPLHQLRDRAPRVTFGHEWIHDSVADLFKNNIARFPMLLGMEEPEIDALEVLRRGGVPGLGALQLHNGTTYTWNRPCYGVSGGIPHLRIECRYLPAGPSVIDEMANFAFWVGLMKGMPEDYRNLKDQVDFRVAKANFMRAAQHGMASSLEWEGEFWTATRLVLEKLLPIAENGLVNCGIAGDDIDIYLGVIRDRCARQQSGSRWMVRNFQGLQKAYGRGLAASLITEAMAQQQRNGLPVHLWDDVQGVGIYPRPFPQLCAGDVMSTDLFTVKEEDPVVLTERIMDWRGIRHLPVEDAEGKLVGILTHTQLAEWSDGEGDADQLVQHIMVPEPICADPDSHLETIREMMNERMIGCVPIVVDQRLVGMITDTDIKRLEQAKQPVSATARERSHPAAPLEC